MIERLKFFQVYCVKCIVFFFFLIYTLTRTENLVKEKMMKKENRKEKQLKSRIKVGQLMREIPHLLIILRDTCL